MRRRSLLAAGLVAALAIGGIAYVYKLRRVAEAAPVAGPAAVPVVAGVVTPHDVPIFLRPAFPSRHPSDFDVLSAIQRRVIELKRQ